MPAPGEFDLIARLKRQAQGEKSGGRAGLTIGIGDDGAVFRSRAGSEVVISADLLVEEIDFRLDWTDPRRLGARALAVSLSDLAAMGARPRWALLSLGVPEKIWRSGFLAKFYEGFFSLAGEHDIRLIGGDISRTPDRLVIDSIVTGEVGRGRAISRAGARPGDLIFVTGALGGAAAGLALLQQGERMVSRRGKRANLVQALLRRQLEPSPRVAWGLELGRRRLASAMIDLSDGLSSDLHHLCRESGVGARLDAARIPLDPHLLTFLDDPSARLAYALDGGEDYELLFTISPRRAAQLPREVQGVAPTQIGEIVERRAGVRIFAGKRGRPLVAAGFAHFRSGSSGL